MRKKSNEITTKKQFRESGPITTGHATLYIFVLTGSVHSSYMGMCIYMKTIQSIYTKHRLSLCKFVAYTISLQGYLFST